MRGIEKNVVFDLGGVVLDWQPEEIIKKVFSDENTQNIVKKDILGHSDWKLLDRGEIDINQTIIRSSKRTSLPQEKIKELMDQVPLSLALIEGTLPLVKKVKNMGHKIFVLSNMPEETMIFLEKEYCFWDIFDGVVVSGRINSIKPEKKIYEYLLNTYHLDPEKTIFIDDTEKNLITAAKMGIKTIRFEDPFQCERDLQLLIY